MIVHNDEHEIMLGGGNMCLVHTEQRKMVLSGLVDSI